MFEAIITGGLIVLFFVINLILRRRERIARQYEEIMRRESENRENRNTLHDLNTGKQSSVINRNE